MKGKLRTPSLLLLLLLFLGTAQAQQVRLVGYLRDSLTQFAIKGTLTNSKTGKKVATGPGGSFVIQASPGDGITVMAPEYRYAVWTVPAFYADTVTIFLTPAGLTLEGVTVEARYSKYQRDSMARRATFNELRGTPLKAVSRPNSGAFGIAINLDRASKQRYRNQQDKEQLFLRREREAYVDYWFSPQTVARLTGLQGEELRLFLYNYRPGYEWTRRNHTDEAMLLYLSKSLKEFRENGKKVR